jgi:hypothetical protein
MTPTRDAIVELRSKGETLEKIGKRFGLTKSRIWQILRKWREPRVYKMFPPIRSEVDFWNRVAITANDDKCWLWQGTLFTRGYGKCNVNKKQCYAHRIAYAYANGKEPELDVLHSCDNPRCVNPKHLSQGTNQDNVADRVKRNRTRTRLPLKIKTAIQVRLSKGDRVCDIALSLDVSDFTIYKIKHQLSGA